MIAHRVFASNFFLMQHNTMLYSVTRDWYLPLVSQMPFPPKKAESWRRIYARRYVFLTALNRPVKNTTTDIIGVQGYLSDWTWSVIRNKNMSALRSFMDSLSNHLNQALHVDSNRPAQKNFSSFFLVEDRKMGTLWFSFHSISLRLSTGLYICKKKITKEGFIFFLKCFILDDL